MIKLITNGMEKQNLARYLQYIIGKNIVHYQILKMYDGTLVDIILWIQEKHTMK